MQLNIYSLQSSPRYRISPNDSDFLPMSFNTRPDQSQTTKSHSPLAP